MLDHLVARGYKPNGGLISSDGIFYLNIPKNASTYLTNLLVANGWEYTTSLDTRITECIVVLRDPIDRWVSGFATYAASWVLGNGYGSDHFVEDYNQLSEKLIFDNLVFDDHTTEQVKYIQQLPRVPTTFFKLNGDIVSMLEEYTKQILVTDSSIEANVSETNYDTKKLSKFFGDKVSKDASLKAKVIERYSEDYELIRTANFYITPRM
jgi:hypothetical protein